MKKRTKRCILAILTSCMLIISACAAEQEIPQKHEQIRIWTWDETFNVKAARLASERYCGKKRGTDIVVEMKEREEICSDIKMMLAAEAYERLPDVILLEDYDAKDMLASHEEEFVNLSDRIDYGKYVDYKSELCRKGDRYYGIPFDCGTTALFYRLDIIEAAGYTQADMQNLTWERYMDIGKDVYNKTGTPMLTLDPTDMPIVRLIMQSCGKWYVDKTGRRADIVENEALYQALDIYRQLLESDLGVSVNGWNEFISAFQNGKVATVLSGGWIMSSIRVAEEQAGLWRIAPIPVVAENENSVAASNVGGSSWYVLKNSAHSREAEDFMVSMFAEDMEFWDQLVVEIGIIPSLKEPSVLKHFYTEDAFFGNQQVTSLMTEYAMLVPAVNYGCRTYEIENILEEEFQYILSSGNVREGLKRVQTRADAVVRE